MPKSIPLTFGKVAIVDDEDFDTLNEFGWHAVRASQGRENWYARRTGSDGENIYMHREISGAEPGQECDHRDGNGLNNKRYNLRLCDRKQNCANIKYEKPTSGYRGVYRHRDGWRAQATKGGKTVNIGFYKDPVMAARARDAYVVGLYGEFAVLNFNDDGRGAS